MKIKINYHKPYSDEIITLVEIEGHSVFTRDISIETVQQSYVHNDTIVIYAQPMPARIDRQADNIILIDSVFAKKSPKPYGLYSDTEYFGKPETIWQQDSVKTETK